MSTVPKPVGIIGGGPAGISAVAALRSLSIPAILFEAGKSISERRHEEAADLAIGVGGAGLFSDGKFSFFPSGTHLYHLDDTNGQLKNAYNWCCELLAQAEIRFEPFPSSEVQSGKPKRLAKGLKRYPAHYASLKQRRTLIRNLEQLGSDCLRLSSLVQEISSQSKNYHLKVMRDYQCSYYKFSRLILATGRFGGMDISEDRLRAALALGRQRYEVGIRVETPSDRGFLCSFDSPDVKRLWSFGDAQIRTFCTCRDGEVWNVPCFGISALSGRSDGAPTGFSNFGLLARFEGASLALGKRIWTELRASSLKTRKVTYEPLASFLSHNSSTDPCSTSNRPWFPNKDFQPGRISDRTGLILGDVLKRAVEALVEWSPDLLHPRSVCLFPAVEGVGTYPLTDSTLRIPDERIWCCGDVVGRFRGLIPSLVSGYYAGLAAAEDWSKEALQGHTSSIAPVTDL